MAISDQFNERYVHRQEQPVRMRPAFRAAVFLILMLLLSVSLAG